MKKLFCLLILGVALGACENAPVEEVDNKVELEKHTVTFSATIGEDEISRTYTAGNKNYWDADDQVGGFAQNNTNVQFSTVQDQPGYFTGDIVGNPEQFYLYYPYQQNATMTGSVISGKLPEVQKLVSGSSHDVMPMVAVTNSFDKLINFTNTCGLIKFAVVSEQQMTLTSLTFEALDKTAPVCGAYKIDMSNPTAPVLTMQNSGTASSVKLEGEVVLKPNYVNYFYVALPPVAFKGGFNVTLTDSNGNVFKTSDYPEQYNFAKDFKMSASKIINVSTIIKFVKVPAPVVGETALELTSLSATTPSVAFTIDQEKMTAQANRTGYTNPSSTRLSLSYKALENGEEVTPTIKINGKNYSSSTSYNLTMPLSIELSYGDMTKTYVAKLSQLTDSGLPVVYINTPSAITSKDDWTPADDDVSDEEFCQIYIDADGRKAWDGTAFEDFAKLNCQVKGRGNTTWEWDKKPYAVKLSKKNPVLGMKKHKRWVLLANAIDKSMIRNTAAFMIAKACYNDGTGNQQGWNPSGYNVELVLNGEHKGNYLLCEQIKIDGNRINIAESKTPTTSTSDQGYLLECDRYWGNDPTEKLYWTSYRESTSYAQLYNYKFTYMYGTNYREGGAQATSGTYKMKFGLKGPDDGDLGENGAGKNTAAYNFIKEKVTNTEKWIFNTMTPSTSLAEISQYIHVDSYIDYWLTFEMAMNQEPNNPGSVYMYYDPSDGLMHAGPIWDFDFGTFKYDFNDSNLYTNKSSHFIVANSVWYCRLLQNTAFQNRVSERWAIIKPLLETTVEQLPTIQTYLATSATYNWNMWNTKSTGDPNGENSTSFSTAANNVYKNAKSRINDLNTLITNKRYY
ncbi:MAG: CotH kinase family protein [Rikenellaceae bacterium]|nr:CotH kinase family protein [Rikenellaceae bacterium]